MQILYCNTNELKIARSYLSLIEQKKNRSGGSREALIGTTPPSDEEIANELKKCQKIAKQKMNKQGVILTGKDVTNFSFCPSYGQRISKKNNKLLPK
jgi:hypothetical protein